MKKKVIISIVLIVLFFGALFALFSDKAIRVIFKEKIWAHRVNSIEKKQEVSKLFSGIELDIVYDKNSGIFDVNHPPAPSINLSLEDYLKSNVDKHLSYWLDFKNLSEDNMVSACEKLNYLTKEVGLDNNKIIVESPNYRFLPMFRSNGFLVSYYLPSLQNTRHDSLPLVIEQIKNALNTSKDLFISSNYKDYSLMKRYFPDRTKLLWLTGGEKSMKKWKTKLSLFKILFDPKVKVFLVPYKSVRGDR